MSSTPKRIMILGHSFVRRLQQFVLRSHSGLNANFNLSESVIVQWLGVGGRTVDKTRRYDMRVVRAFRPDIVLIQLGTNDLPTAPPLQVGSDIEELVKLLHSHYNVKVVVVCQTLWRDSDQDFNNNVVALNQYSQVFLEHLPFVLFWKHRGFWNTRENIYLRDGVHLNDRGQVKLYRSFRGAIHQALRLLNELPRFACQ
jgi:lysophospholipase L1-like esterase